MDSHQIHKDRDQILDSYIRNELSDRETELLEEHLLYCKDCRDALSERNRIVGSIQRLGAKEVLPYSSHGKTRSIRYLPLIGYAAVAASVALVLGLFVFPGRNHPSSSSRSVLEEMQADTLNTREMHREEIAAMPDTGEVPARHDSGRKMAYLPEFQANPLYENLIGVQYRSGNLKVQSPPDSMACFSGASITFRYEGAGSDSLFLVLLTPQGGILMEKKIGSPYPLEMQVPEGLYYWQLTNEEEALHTAKILVIPES